MTAFLLGVLPALAAVAVGAVGTVRDWKAER